jgi:hypothetical protein
VYIDTYVYEYENIDLNLYINIHRYRSYQQKKQDSYGNKPDIKMFNDFSRDEIKDEWDLVRFGRLEKKLRYFAIFIHLHAIFSFIFGDEERISV